MGAAAGTEVILDVAAAVIDRVKAMLLGMEVRSVEKKNVVWQESA